MNRDNQAVGSRDVAEALALRLLREEPRESIHDLVINVNLTKEHDWGWVVSYCNRAFLETGDRDHVLIGAGPFLIARDGRVFACGSGTDVDHYVELLDCPRGLRGIPKKLWLWGGGLLKRPPFAVPSEEVRRALEQIGTAPQRRSQAAQ